MSLYEEEDDEEEDATVIKQVEIQHAEKIVEVKPNKPLEKGLYYIEKSIFVVSKYPFFEQFERILLDLHNAIIKEGLLAPLEDYIARLVYQVPAPPRGIQNVKLRLISKTLPQKDVTVFYPPINRLPYVDKNCINSLFDSLNVDNILLFFKRILLDSNVILSTSNTHFQNLMVSNDKRKLV